MTTLELSDPLAQALLAAPNNNDRVLCFVGTTCYRLYKWTLTDGTMRVEWQRESDCIKAATIPWQWRLKWRLRTLVRKVV